MSRHQVRRVLTGVAATAMALTLIPAAHAAPSVAPAGASTEATETREKLPVEIRVKVATRDPRVVATTRVWATQVLADENVTYDRDDQVQVVRAGRVVRSVVNRRLRAGDTVKITRVGHRTVTQRKRVANRTVTRKVDHLRPGQRKVVAQGRDGIRKVTITRTLHNGVVVDRERTSRMVRSPKPRRVNVGRARWYVPGTSHLNWAALANCESSGNPRAVNPAGYYGLYQFDTGTWASVGGSGLPSRASAAEQTYRAKRLYKSRGRSPWPHCGRYL